jgi:hypothetical protein
VKYPSGKNIIIFPNIFITPKIALPLNINWVYTTMVVNGTKFTL